MDSEINTKIKIKLLIKRICCQFSNGGYRSLLFAYLSLIFAIPTASATITAAAVADPLFAKGYLNVEHYGVLPSASAAVNTAGINEAIVDAYNRDNNTALPGGGTLQGSLALYFPTGTYEVNDTLTAHTATGTPTGSPSHFDVPKNHLTIVGSTLESRPKLKLAAGSSGYSNAATPKYLLEFRNWKIDPANGNITSDEAASEGYHQMLRGIDLDCNGFEGCIALYFSNAQNSSVEDVTIEATGAHTGIRGGAGSAGGFMNIVIEGGINGIDTSGDSITGSASRPGIVIAGVKLRRQTTHSVKHNGFAPLTIVGFEIVTPVDSTRAAIITQSGASGSNFAAINLIDGIIRMGGDPAQAVIDNTQGKNFYARNVYVVPATGYSGSTTPAKLIKSGATLHTASTAISTKKRINEYNYTITGADGNGKLSQNLINGTTTTLEYPDITDNVLAPSISLVNNHVWGRLPTVDDTDAHDVSSGAGGLPVISPGTAVSHTDLQTIIDAHAKVFIPKGIYQLTGSITLNADTILFGAGRGLTRIEVADTWNPTVETAIIQTDNDTTNTAITYLGNLSIGIDATNIANDFFTALHWKSGGSSMVHMGQVYRSPSSTSPTNRWTTQPHSLIKISGNGGGRWYFTGAIKNFTSQAPDPSNLNNPDPNNLYNGPYRILKVENTNRPLWFYSLNPESPRGVDTYMEFNNAQNVRIYGLKSEYNFDSDYAIKSSVLKFRNDSDNVAVFGHGALRNGVENKGAIEFYNTTNALATLIAPQSDLISGVSGAKTINEVGYGGASVAYPDIVTLYKRGTIDDAPMVHSAPSY